MWLGSFMIKGEYLLAFFIHTYWWTWGWRSGWQQPTQLCGQESVSHEPPGSHHRESPKTPQIKEVSRSGVAHTQYVSHMSCLVFSHSHTCFLRLFITPMMLDSCLYSSLVAHFLSLFFLELDAFSGEATPVMSARSMKAVHFYWTATLSAPLPAACSYSVFVVAQPSTKMLARKSQKACGNSIK